MDGYPVIRPFLADYRRAAFATAPQPGYLGGVIPVAPVGYNAMLTDYLKPNQTFIVCPNQDVVYGAGFTDLDKEPTVIQVPDFRYPAKLGKLIVRIASNRAFHTA